MKITITFFILTLCTFSLFAQSPNAIKGTAVDTSSKAKLINATICVLNAKDSIIRKFTYAKTNGEFAITGLPSGKFIMLVSYPEYADYVEMFSLDAAHPTHDFGVVNMQLKSKVLHDVLIKGTVTAIKIKGDTTEFNAKAYVIQPNDKVEDLLKQLPGIQVDKDGKITANGQAVNKVLVDGEEFFGDDPTLVTKNLRADMVASVQLYDKKSDQATFTGVDDGVKTKTINIKLKEDKKNGVFGKATAGVGNQGYYEGQGIYNRFKAKEKYSAYGTTANDGKTGLGFTDNNSLGASGSNVQVGDDGGIFITSFSNDALDSFDGNYNGQGQPIAHSGGVHFDNKWDNDKQTINTNYKVGSIDVKGVTETKNQQDFATGQLNSNSNQTFDNYAFRQKLDVTYSVKLDTSSTLKVSVDGTLKNFTVINTYNTVTTGLKDTLLNTNQRKIDNKGNQQLINASAFYTKKFHKTGRTFSWNLTEAYNHNDTKGYLNSELDIYKTGVRDSVQLINEYKTSNTISSVFSSNMTWSEPLSKTISMVFSYGFGLNNSTADRKTFDELPLGGEYTVLNSTYSNNYKFNQLTNQPGAAFSYKKNKISFNIGTKVSDVNFKQVDEYTGVQRTRDYVNWIPQAYFTYRPSLQKSFSINYNGYTTQPTIDQIQPVPVNTDPLNVTLGNTNLKPAFSNNIYAFYNTTKVVSGASSYVSGSFSFKDDAIVSNTVTTASGKTTVQSVNLTNNTPINYYLNASTNRKIASTGISAGPGINTSGNINYNFIDGALNKSESYSYSLSLNINKYVAKKYSFYMYAGPSYTINTFSARPLNNNNASGFNGRGSGSYYLPKKFMLSSDIYYTYTGATSAFNAQQRAVWNASLSKAFFANDDLTFSLNANDILNQNVNFSRRINGNNITQTNTTGIKRYLMLSVIWNFTKFSTLPSKN